MHTDPDSLSRANGEGYILENSGVILCWSVSESRMRLMLKRLTLEYRAESFSIRRSPLVGHAAGGCLSVEYGGSRSMLIKSCKRSRLNRRYQLDARSRG
jgi:hypothetical protein